AAGMSTRTRRADFHQGQGSFATPISQAGYMTATRFSLPVPHPCTRAGSIYDTKAHSKVPVHPCVIPTEVEGSCAVRGARPPTPGACAKVSPQCWRDCC